MNPSSNLPDPGTYLTDLMNTQMQQSQQNQQLEAQTSAAAGAIAGPTGTSTAGALNTADSVSSSTATAGVTGTAPPAESPTLAPPSTTGTPASGGDLGSSLLGSNPMITLTTVMLEVLAMQGQTQAMQKMLAAKDMEGIVETGKDKAEADKSMLQDQAAQQFMAAAAAAVGAAAGAYSVKETASGLKDSAALASTKSTDVPLAGTSKELDTAVTKQMDNIEATSVDPKAVPAAPSDQNVAGAMDGKSTRSPEQQNKMDSLEQKQLEIRHEEVTRQLRLIDQKTGMVQAGAQAVGQGATAIEKTVSATIDLDKAEIAANQAILESVGKVWDKAAEGNLQAASEYGQAVQSTMQAWNESLSKLGQVSKYTASSGA